MVTIKVKLLNKMCDIAINSKGDWIDLKAAQSILFDAPQSKVLRYETVNGEKVGYRNVEYDTKLIPLGVAMQLPKGYEAIIAPRSSTDTKFKIDCANSIGIIDGSYNGNNDQWHFKARGLKACTIEEGDRICQFRIQLNQNATSWQKVKWLFSSKIKIKYVDKLNSVDRGGFGSTGIK